MISPPVSRGAHIVVPFIPVNNPSSSSLDSRRNLLCFFTSCSTTLRLGVLMLFRTSDAALRSRTYPDLVLCQSLASFCARAIASESTNSSLTPNSALL